jgi:hypothetical protein
VNSSKRVLGEFPVDKFYAGCDIGYGLGYVEDGMKSILRRTWED